MEFRFWLPQASSFAPQSDALFYAMVGLSVLVIGSISVTALVFLYRYRSGSRASRKGEGRRRHWLEFTWIVIPLGLFLAIFFWAADLYSELFYPPPDAIEIYVVGKQWMWKVQHANGRREIDTLHIPRGRPIKLTMASEDVIHSFFIPAFRVKHDVVPGRYAMLWFTATETGTYHLFCAEFCGTDHANMRGRVVVMEPERYARWLQQGQPQKSMATAGRELFQSYGCSGCHGAAATVDAPKLSGLFGKPVPLQRGGTVIADEAYIRDSILLPRKQIAAGYAPIMPSFQDQISEAEILQIVAYIKSISDGEAAP